MPLVDELADAMGDRGLITDPDVLETYRWDRTTWVTPGQPVAAVFPTTTAQVSAAMQIAASHDVPVIPRGAGSSLCAGSQARDGSLIVCLERMNRILEINTADQVALVEPGVINAAISTAGAQHGLWYPPDPASRTFCSIGGNIATNAGGLCCVKYGVTRDYVLGLEVVLADGTVIETGHQTIKGVAGLDLTSLFVGSEGTLGIVTRIRLRLRAAPAGASTAVAYFPSLGTAGEAVSSIVRSGLVLSLMEMMDHTTISAVDDVYPMDLDRDAAALLLLQSDSEPPVRDAEIGRAAEWCDRAGASWVATTDDDDESEALLQARRLAIPALEQQGDTLLDDVAVPRSAIADYFGRAADIAADRDVTIGNFGHAGDGNLHPTIVIPRSDGDALDRARDAFDDLVVSALDLGGTITGEHGVGQIKAPFLEREIGADNLALQRRIKQTLDPQNLLNPGRWL